MIISLDLCSLFVQHPQVIESGFNMHTGLDLLVLMVAVGGAWLAAAFAALNYFGSKRTTEPLTASGAAQLLRAETDIVRGAVDDQAGRLRQELNQSLKGFQELTVGAFGGLRDGIEGQVRGFGPREDYEHLQEATAAGDAKLITHFRRELEAKIKACAKEISSKYINPPHTLEFAILFVPTEACTPKFCASQAYLNSCNVITGS